MNQSLFDLLNIEPSNSHRERATAVGRTHAEPKIARFYGQLSTCALVRIMNIMNRKLSHPFRCSAVFEYVGVAADADCARLRCLSSFSVAVAILLIHWPKWQKESNWRRVRGARSLNNHLSQPFVYGRCRRFQSRPNRTVGWTIVLLICLEISTHLSKLNRNSAST